MINQNNPQELLFSSPTWKRMHSMQLQQTPQQTPQQTSQQTPQQTPRKKKAVNKPHNMHIRLTNHQYAVICALSRQNSTTKTKVITDYLDSFKLVKKQNTASHTTTGSNTNSTR